MMQFLQRKELIVGPVKVSSKSLHIDFNIPFDDDPEPNESSVTVYNLSQNTINQIKRNATLTLTAGYEGDEGVVLAGRVSKVETKFDGPDKATTIYSIDGASLDDKKTLKRAYKANIRASQVIRELVPMLGLPVAVLKLPSDKTYAKGLSITASIVNKLQELCKDCGASFYVSRGKIYIRSIKEGDDARFTLSPDTGLIGSPEPFEEERDGKIIRGYNLTCLLQHRISTGSVIELSSKAVKGRFRVRRGNHLASGTDFITDLEVLA